MCALPKQRGNSESSLIFCRFSEEIQARLVKNLLLTRYIKKWDQIMTLLVDTSLEKVHLFSCDIFSKLRYIQYGGKEIKGYIENLKASIAAHSKHRQANQEPIIFYSGDGDQNYEKEWKHGLLQDKLNPNLYFFPFYRLSFQKIFINICTQL